MWAIVHGGRFDVRFRRQPPSGPFIADFFCAERGLVVERDGPQHGDDPPRDERRTRWLEARAYRVLRFANEQVMGDQQVIRAALLAAITPLHPPR